MTQNEMETASEGAGATASPAARLAGMRAEVRASLLRDPKELPSKYFYDERGSRLFERITELPEYYLTRTERALLERNAARWVQRVRPRALIELGAGSADKTRILLDAMREEGTAEQYVPIDVSADFLDQTAMALRRMYGGLSIRPVVADIGIGLDLPEDRSEPAFFAFLGGTVGNFEAADAIALLSRIRMRTRSGDRLLLGVDLRKDPTLIEAAYNDAAGLTAEFNRNILTVLNTRLESDFDPELFQHRAIYNGRLQRIEMWLVARRYQEVHLRGIGTIPFAKGEGVRTEISCKYDRASVEELLTACGFRLTEWAMDEDALFAIALAEPV